MRTSLLTLALGSLVASCSSSKSPEPSPQKPLVSDPLPAPSPVSPMVANNDRCDAVRDLVVDTVVHQLINPGYGYGYGHPHPPPMRAEVAMDAGVAPKAEPAAPVATGSAAQQAGPGHYTTTNVQEKNVDEGDLVKTDGKHIYTLRNGELVIAKTWPIKDTELASRIQFKNMQPTQIYLNGDTVIVHGVANINEAPYNVTRVAVIDVKNREQPELVRTYDVDGMNASSRVVDGDLYLVQNAAVNVPQKLYTLGQETLAKIPRADQQTLKPWEIQSRLARTLRSTLLQHITSADIAAALPSIKSGSSKETMRCGDLYMPQGNAQLGMTALARISIDNQRNDIVGAMVSGGQVYASTESIYVSAPTTTWNDQGWASSQTAVHKFSLTANDGRPTYVASGAVDGQVLNQFSLSEHAGDLRIATTDWNWNGQQGGNHLFVLRTKGRVLETIGAIRGLAKGERIYSGRMFGDKGYIVTFRQTDPLFTLDLSDPKNPKVAGELKINGFSNYIHPMGNDLLLTIGQDADDNGRQTGFHMQVFDVSNPAKPTRRFHEKLDSWSSYSSSIAEQDHKAFTYDPVTGTLALPVAGSTADGQQFNGLVVYDIDPKHGFTLHGRVTHRGLASEVIDDMCKDTDDPWAGNNPYFCQQANRAYAIPQYSQIDRSIVVDNYLLSLGTAGLEIHQLGKLGTRAARLRWPMPNVTRSEADLVVMAD